MAMARISRAILGDEHSVLTVSSLLQGEYGLREVCLGAPCVVGREGVKAAVTLSLTPPEVSQLYHSADLLLEALRDIQL